MCVCGCPELPIMTCLHPKGNYNQTKVVMEPQSPIHSDLQGACVWPKQSQDKHSCNSIHGSKTSNIYMYISLSFGSYPVRVWAWQPFLPHGENLRSILKEKVTHADLRCRMRDPWQHHMGLLGILLSKLINVLFAFDRCYYISVIYIQKSLYEYKVLICRESWSPEVFKTSKDSDLYLATLFLILKAEVTHAQGSTTH